MPARFPVVYTLDGQTFRSRASTLGGGGMFIEEAASLPPRAEISLTFRPAKHLPYLHAKARVCYVIAGRGSGLEFVEINREHQQLILRLIHHKTGNRRHYARVALPTQIHIQDLMTLAFSRDVSVGGLFVETKAQSEVGTRLDLRFHLDDGGPVVIATVEVRYRIPALGMGVTFLDLSRDDRRRIEKFVAACPSVLPPPATPALSAA